MEQNTDSNMQDNHVKDYRKQCAEDRKHAYFYEKTTPLSRLIKMAQKKKRA